jgi:hypothetical protein
MQAVMCAPGAQGAAAPLPGAHLPQLHAGGGLQGAATLHQAGLQAGGGGDSGRHNLVGSSPLHAAVA